MLLYNDLKKIDATKWQSFYGDALVLLIREIVLAHEIPSVHMVEKKLLMDGHDQSFQKNYTQK